MTARTPAKLAGRSFSAASSVATIRKRVLYLTARYAALPPRGVDPSRTLHARNGLSAAS
jgi:hypothetical protein